jgi:uncharacterized protein YcgL (UPF0745 family)
MVVNFKAREISRGAHKLTHISMLIKKQKKYLYHQKKKERQIIFEIYKRIFGFPNAIPLERC